MPLFAQTATAAPVDIWPLYILGISVGFIILAITALRLHPFLALISAAMLAGLLASTDLESAVNAVRMVSEAFGQTATGVGLVIALAAIIGMSLMDSGAADQIVRRFMRVFGEKRAGWALMASGFFLSIPVFFDTVFFLLVPLARMLGIRTGRNYMYYVLAIAGGGAITHSIVPPTPGPLLVGGELGLNLGTIMVAGFIAGLFPAMVALMFSRGLDRWFPVPVRETKGSSLEDLHDSIAKADEELPSFGISVMPVILPALLLATFAFLDMFEKNGIEKSYPPNLVARAESADLPPATTAAAVYGQMAQLQAQLNEDPAEINRDELRETIATARELIAARAGTSAPTADSAPSHESAEPPAVGSTNADLSSDAELPDLPINPAADEAGPRPDNGLPTAPYDRAAVNSRDAVLMALAMEFDTSRGQGIAVAPAIEEVLLEEALEDPGRYTPVHAVMKLLGDKVVALGLGALIAILILMKQAGIGFRTLSEKCAGPLETAGIIILITSAGGAFGAMIRHTGIGEVISFYGEDYQVNYIVLAWTVTAIIRIAQGSATVSMITGAGLMTAVLASGVELEYHKLYIFLAIGFGSITCSWMNDSGFWIVGKLSGFTERETLKTWTPLLTVIALAGLLETWLAAKFIPLL